MFAQTLPPDLHTFFEKLVERICLKIMLLILVTFPLYEEKIDVNMTIGTLTC